MIKELLVRGLKSLVGGYWASEAVLDTSELNKDVFVGNDELQKVEPWNSKWS